MRRALALLVLVIALIAAGCGGDSNSAETSKQDYGKQVAAAGAAAQKTLSGIADETGAQSDSAAIADRLDAGTKAIDDTITNLKKITPPAEVKTQHQMLIDGLGELSAVFQQCADAARKGDAKALVAALKSLASNPGTQKLAQAQQQLKAKGITIPDSAG